MSSASRRARRLVRRYLPARNGGKQGSGAAAAKKPAAAKRKAPAAKPAAPPPAATQLARAMERGRSLEEAVVAQVRAYFARPWADGEPDEVVREFVCECGDPACDVDLHLTVGDVAAGPVFAPGHG